MIQRGLQTDPLALHFVHLSVLVKHQRLKGMNILHRTRFPIQLCHFILHRDLGNRHPSTFAGQHIVVRRQAEFITNLRHSVLSHPNLDEGVALAIAVFVNLIHVPALIVPRHLADIPGFLRPRRQHRPRRQSQGNDFANEDVIGCHVGVLRNEAVICHFLVVCVLHVFGFRRIRPAELLFLPRRLILALFVLVGAIEDGAKATTVQCRPINHVGILLVVSRVRHNRHNDILTRRERLGTKRTTHVRAHHGFFGITQHMRHRIKALTKVEGIDAHGLFSHRGIVRTDVPRGDEAVMFIVHRDVGDTDTLVLLDGLQGNEDHTTTVGHLLQCQLPLRLQTLHTFEPLYNRRRGIPVSNIIIFPNEILGRIQQRHTHFVVLLVLHDLTRHAKVFKQRLHLIHKENRLFPCA